MSGVRTALWCIALALLAACGSTPPTTYYVLSAELPAAPAAERPRVGIVALDVAEYLLAAQVSGMDGANRVRRAEFARWAEPLDAGIARVLALDLGQRLGTQGVRLGPWPREWVPDQELRVRIQRLDAGANEARLVAAWSLQDGAHAHPARDRLTQLTRARSATDAAATAADFSALLADLAGVIAGDITHGGDAAATPE